MSLLFFFCNLTVSDTNTTTTEEVHTLRNSITGSPILCMPVLSEKEKDSSTGRNIKNKNEFSISTEKQVHDDVVLENEPVANNVPLRTFNRGGVVQNNHKNRNQTLLYCKETIDSYGEYEEDSLLDIAKDVEFIDSFPFDSVELDELEDYFEEDEIM